MTEKMDRKTLQKCKMRLEFVNVHHGWTNVVFSFFDYTIKVRFSAVMDTFPDFLDWINRIDGLAIGSCAWVDVDEEGRYKRLLVRNIDGNLFRFKISQKNHFSFQINVDRQFLMCQIARMLNDYVVDFPGERWAGGFLDEIIRNSCSSVIEKYKANCIHRPRCSRLCKDYRSSPPSRST